MKPKAAQKRKPDQETFPFLEAIKFISLAQKDNGEIYQTHVSIMNKTAVAYDGKLAAGVFIDEELSACPHTELLLNALSKQSGTISIAQKSASQLLITSGKFSAHVPCVGFEVMPYVLPDPPITPINNKFIEGLRKIAGLSTETSEHVVTSSVLIRSGSMCATDRHIIVEYWHGNHLPVLSLPKAAAVALIKCGKELKEFGFSATTATFHFTDNSWLKTQLYEGAWPDVDRILNISSNPWPMPQGFFDGVRAVAPFNENGWITFRKNELASQDDPSGGATYAVSGIPAGPVFNSKYLLVIEPLAKSIDFVADKGRAAFFGDDLRGIMLGIVDNN